MKGKETEKATTSEAKKIFEMVVFTGYITENNGVRSDWNSGFTFI